MIKAVISLVFACTSLLASGQNAPNKFNQALADSLGADEYGMKMYVLVMLKSGSFTANKAVSDSMFVGHMQNINRLVSAGKLVVAGPLQKNDKSYRGIFILDAKTTAEANELLSGDPAIKNHLLDAELYSWYGSAALPKYLPFHKQVEKKKH